MKSTPFSRASLPCFMLSVVIAGCSHQDRPPGQVLRPVKLIRTGEAAVGKATSFAGEVQARYETALSFRVSGKMIARRVEIGGRVHKGQALASLDADDYRLALQNLQAQLKSALAECDFAKDDLNRYRELLAQRVVSPPEFDRRQTASTTAEERVTALQAQLGQTSNALDYTELRADRDGVVTALEVETGEVLAAGRPVLKLAQLHDKEIRIDIPEHRIGQIHPGEHVAVTLWAGGGRRLKARIREIASAADPSSRTYRVKATLLEGLEAAQLGMTATVWIASNADAKIAVPLSAVFTPQQKPEQPQVWVVDEQSGTVSAVPVRIGAPLDGERIAVEGLAPGQLLVSAGVQRLTEGQAVRLPEALAALSKKAGDGGLR